MTGYETHPRTQLSAGPLRALFYRGDLRYMKIGPVEMVRRVYVAVRDTSWGTVEPELTEEQIRTDADGFAIEYDARHAQGDIDFTWHATIRATAGTSAEGVPEATVTFEMDGVAGSSFRTSRTGFCLLHPLRGCVGQPVVIEHPDGSRERGEFPRLILPTQPFYDVVGMEQPFDGGCSLAVRFEGEVFETEDQRNWADGSFKTYCRPLRLPFPYPLERGQRVRQSVRLRFTGKPVAESREPFLQLHDEVSGRVPAIGLRLPTPGKAMSDQNAVRLKALRLSHLRADVRLSDSGWQESLSGAAGDASRLQVPLELAVHAAGPSEAPVAALAQAAGRAGVRAARWIVYEAQRSTPSTELMALARRHLAAGGAAALCGGTAGNFVDVNRWRPQRDLVPGLAYPITPQSHSTDDLSLIENLQAHGDTVATARAFAPGSQICLGPVVLHRRPDPFAAGMDGGEQQAVPDPRQRLPLGAAWTLGSVASLAAFPPDSVTYYDTIGPFGVTDGDTLFPLYHVLGDVGEFGRCEVLRLSGPDPLRVAALAMRNGPRLRLLLASFDPAPQVLALSGFDRYRPLPAGKGADLREVTIPPGAYLRLDFEARA